MRCCPTRGGSILDWGTASTVCCAWRSVDFVWRRPQFNQQGWHTSCFITRTLLGCQPGTWRCQLSITSQDYESVNQQHWSIHDSLLAKVVVCEICHRRAHCQQNAASVTVCQPDLPWRMNWKFDCILVCSPLFGHWPRLYILLLLFVYFFFRQPLSELTERNSTRLCHIHVEKWAIFTNARPKFWIPSH